MSADRRPRVLIVDDAEPVRDALWFALVRDTRVQVVGEVADAHEALAAVRALQPEIVLLDLVMPGMDGLDAMDGIHALRPSTTVLLMSVSDVHSYAARERTRAADGFIRKDLDLAGLGDRVLAAHWGRRRREGVPS